MLIRNIATELFFCKNNAQLQGWAKTILR